jgi:hypothetical protein
VHLYDRGCITHLFNRFALTLKVDSMKLEVREIGSNQLLKTIDLPSDLKLQNTVRNFLPVGMSTNCGQLKNDDKGGQPLKQQSTFSLSSTRNEDN